MLTEWRCRVRKGRKRETIGHILSSCPEHVWGLIKSRHDKMLYQLTREIVRTLGIPAPTAPEGHSKTGHNLNREI